LPPEDFVRACEGTCERLVAAEGFVCRKGEPVDHWFGVIDGLAKMSSDWASGKTASYTGIAAGGWFGEGSMLKQEPRRYDVIALRDTHVACMKRETFHWLLDHSIPFNRFIINQINERLGLFIGLLESERLAGHRRTRGTRHRRTVPSGAATRHRIAHRHLAGRDRPARRRLAPARQSRMQTLEKSGFLSPSTAA
jgi:CRP-like cAMP-binding protein